MSRSTYISLKLIALFLIQHKVTSSADVSRTPSDETSPPVDDDVMNAVALATKAAQADLGYHSNLVGTETEARLSGMLNLARQLLRMAKEEEMDSDGDDLARVLVYGKPEVALRGGRYRRPNARSVTFGRRLEPEENQQQDSKIIMKAMRYGRK